MFSYVFHVRPLSVSPASSMCPLTVPHSVSSCSFVIFFPCSLLCSYQFWVLCFYPGYSSSHRLYLSGDSFSPPHFSFSPLVLDGIFLTNVRILWDYPADSFISFDSSLLCIPSFRQLFFPLWWRRSSFYGDVAPLVSHDPFFPFFLEKNPILSNDVLWFFSAWWFSFVFSMFFNVISKVVGLTSIVLSCAPSLFPLTFRRFRPPSLLDHKIPPIAVSRMVPHSIALFVSFSSPLCGWDLIIDPAPCCSLKVRRDRLASGLVNFALLFLSSRSLGLLNPRQGLVLPPSLVFFFLVCYILTTQRCPWLNE